MDPDVIQLYEHQLAQVESALESDPSNFELQNLKDELVNLITLTKSLVGAEESTATLAASAPATAPSAAAAVAAGPSTSNIHAPTASISEHRYAAGDDVQAKYAGDGRWYPARIVSVGGSSDNPIYSVIFKGYNNTDLVTSSDIRPSKNRPIATSPPHTESTSASASPAPAAPTSTATTGGTNRGKKKLTPAEEDEWEKKRRRNEKKTERFEAKQAAQVDKQAAWQKFAKKGIKKGVIPGQKSIFKTPDDPYAKVGVVGGGRGMTNYNSRSKHVYEGEGGQS